MPWGNTLYVTLNVHETAKSSKEWDFFWGGGVLNQSIFIMEIRTCTISLITVTRMIPVLTVEPEQLVSCVKFRMEKDSFFSIGQFVHSWVVHILLRGAMGQW